MSVEVVILVLAGLVAVNLVLVNALLTTDRRDRRRSRPKARSASRPPTTGTEPSRGPRAGSV